MTKEKQKKDAKPATKEAGLDRRAKRRAPARMEYSGGDGKIHRKEY